jgi:glucose/arabinose dehydrogenase
MNSFTNPNSKSPLEPNLSNTGVSAGVSPSPLESNEPQAATTLARSSSSGLISSMSLGGGDGLKGEYFDNIDFTNPKLTRTDSTVNFNWGSGSPNPSLIAPDTFSVRWTGQVEALFNETYTFSTTTDDGVRLWVNNQLIIDKFVNQSPREWSGSINLQAGQRYDIRMDYFENTGGAVSRLSWSSASQTKQIIPQSQLFSSIQIPDGIPVARLELPDNVTNGGGETYTFRVTYRDDTAVNAASLDNSDIRVTGPGAFNQLATLVSVDTPGDGTPRTATYRINAPGGTWNIPDNGIYTIALEANQVSDNSGNFVVAGNLGTFQTNVVGTGTGLTGQYYDNRDFTDLKLKRIDSTVNFNWGNGSPDPTIAPDTFSVRWTGQVEALYNETYTFFTRSDDGVRLFVNGQQIINRFINQSPTEVASTPIPLQAGQKYDITLEYFENTGVAVSELRWSSASQAKQIIAQSQLYADVSAPTAVVSTTNVSVPGDSTYNFTVTYSDNLSVDITSLDNNDIRVTGPNGFNQLATFVNVEPAGNGAPRTATYSITAPSGVWDATDNGFYSIRLETNQVRDTSGNFAGAGNLGSFRASVPGTGTGLKAEYYDNRDFTNLKLIRTDSTVDFDWGLASPDPMIAPDTFSAVWTGKVQPLYNENYTFYTTTDDGVRLFVNGQLIVNRFRDQGATEVASTPITLEAGKKYDIRMEYYENGVLAVSKLGWSSASQAKQIIPQSQLYIPVTLPTIRLASNNPDTVSEADGFVRINLERVGEDLSMTSTIQYATTQETAIAGQDYTQTIGIATFLPGQTTATIDIPILQDTLIEDTETFTFGIDVPGNSDLGVPRTLRIGIEDDDRTDLFFGTPPIVDENTGTVTVTVKRGRVDGVASVDFTTVNGTAIAGSDYGILGSTTPVTGTLNFAPGERSKTISINLIDDNIGEPNEGFSISLSNAIGVDLTPNNTSTNITIIDDDPGNFTRLPIVSGLTQPTAFEWTPNGERMYIAEKSGIVKVFENGNVLATPFIDISQQVNNVRDRGLLGIEVHPDFPNNPYIYLLFTHDPQEVYNPENINNPNNLAGPDEEGNRPSKLIRVTADASTNFTTAVAGSEVVLLGTNSTWANTSRPDLNSTPATTEAGQIAPSGIINRLTGQRFTSTQDYLNNLSNAVNIQDYLATDSESHTVGDLEFAPDGSLFVTNGDGVSYNRVDPRAIRVQDVNNLSGKVLRINPITGQGYDNNPFHQAGDSLDSNRSKVFNYGLRNPFRMTINPTTGLPVVGDVGKGLWEEANTGRGQNFGWPYYEGGDGISLIQPEYSSLPQAQAFYNSGQPVTAAFYAYPHTPGGNAILMGDYYTSNVYPSVYRNNLFIGDIAKGTIEALTLNSQGRVVASRRFDTIPGRNVQLTQGRDGLMYYANLDRGEIGRWVVSGGNAAPARFQG